MKREINKLMADGKTLRCCYPFVPWGMRSMNFSQCNRRATVTRKGGCYCKQHDPIERQRKSDEKQKAWAEKWERQDAAFERNRNIRELFPKLVAALDNYKLSPEHQSFYKKAKSLTT